MDDIGPKESSLQISKTLTLLTEIHENMIRNYVVKELNLRNTYKKRKKVYWQNIAYRTRHLYS